MAWIQIDDQFDEHPKLQQVGPLCWGVWLAGLAYCNRNLTDGFIPWTKAKSLVSFEIVEDDGKVWELTRCSGMAGEDIDAGWVIGLLIDAGLWEEVSNGRGRIDGYQVHDYQDWQRTKNQILEDRAKKVAAGQAGGQASAQARAQAKSKQNPTHNHNLSKKPNPLPKEESEEEENGSLSFASANAPKSIKETPIQPVPKPKKTTIPDDFMVTDAMRQQAEGYGVPCSEIDRQTDMFRDWASQDAKQKTDWLAAWRNWMRRVSEFAPRQPNGRASPSNGTPLDRTLANIREIKQQLRDNEDDIIETEGRVQ